MICPVCKNPIIECGAVCEWCGANYILTEAKGTCIDEDADEAQAECRFRKNARRIWWKIIIAISLCAAIMGVAKDHISCQLW